MFIKFQIEDMIAALQSVAPGPVTRATDEMHGASEVILAVPTQHPKVTILVYTSYVPSKEESRDYAADAVKFVIRYVGQTETRYVGNLKKINRSNGGSGIEGFLARVKGNVKYLSDLVVPLRKCTCGSLLVPRYAGNEKFFFGCLNFPECRNSESIS